MPERKVFNASWEDLFPKRRIKTTRRFIKAKTKNFGPKERFDS